MGQISVFGGFPLQIAADGRTEINRPLIDGLKVCQTEAFGQHVESLAKHRQDISCNRISKHQMHSI